MAIRNGFSFGGNQLMAMATEELSGMEFPGHAVALNLENAPISMQEETAKDPIVHAVLSGQNRRHVLSSGLSGAMPPPRSRFRAAPGLR